MHIYFDNASTTPLYPEVMEEMFEVQKSIVAIHLPSIIMVEMQGHLLKKQEK